MNLYDANGNETDIIEAITTQIEKESGKTIFTLVVLDDEEKATQKDEIKALIVFEDKSVLSSVITVQLLDEKIGVRVRGNYL
jgi:hypothetical protein